MTAPTSDARRLQINNRANCLLRKTQKENVAYYFHYRAGC